jgi:hypothetical protein
MEPGGVHAQPAAEGVHAPSEDRMQEPSYELGILYVHGIGQQVRGETLNRFGGAVAEWLSRQDMDGDLRSPLPAMLDPEPLVHPAMPTSGSADAPPCAEINWKRGDQRWLIAESWWQGDVAPPKFRRLALWSIPKLPAIAVDFFVGYTRRALKTYNLASLLIAAALLVLAPLLALGVVVLVLLLLALDFVPVIRSRVRTFTLGAAQTLGDSYLLLREPVQGAVMIGRLERDLDWLAANSQRVVIVAHSQGAALSHLVCQRLPERNPMVARRVAALITVGSALWRLRNIEVMGRSMRLRLAGTFGVLGGAALVYVAWSRGPNLGRLVSSLSFQGVASPEVAEALRQINPLLTLVLVFVQLLLLQALVWWLHKVRDLRRRPAVRKLYWLARLVLLAVVASLAWEFWRIGMALQTLPSTPGGVRSQLSALRDTIPTLVFASVLLVLASYLTFAREKRHRAEVVEEIRLESLNPHFVWKDYRATHDPVRFGNGAEDCYKDAYPESGGFFQSHDVHNAKLMLQDHSLYFRNRDEFVTSLVIDLVHAALGREPEPRHLSGWTAKDLREVATRRRERGTYLLVLGRTFITLSGTLMLLGLGTEFNSRTTGPCAGRSVLCEVGNGVPAALVAPLPGPPSWRQSYGNATFASEDVYGLIIVAAVVALVLALSRWVWHRWEVAAVRAIYHGPGTEGRQRFWWAPMVGLYVGVVSAGGATMLSIGAGRLRFGEAPASGEVLLPAALMFVPVLAGLGLYVAGKRSLRAVRTVRTAVDPAG